MKVITTERLALNKIIQDDYQELKNILQNEELMLLGWGKTYSDEEVQTWINTINKQYDEYGYSYYLATEKSTNKVIGLMGILPITIKETDYIEIAYIIKEEFQGRGYAIEGMKACVDYIFNTINADMFIAQVIPDNISSAKIAEKLGMKITDEYVRNQNGKEKRHLIYSLTK